MAKGFLYPGNRIDIAANVITVAVQSGQLWQIAKLTGVLLHGRPANAENVMQIEGVFQVAKDTAASSGGAVGTQAYVKDVSGELKATADATGSTAFGTFFATSQDADTTAQVKLHGGVVGVP